MRKTSEKSKVKPAKKPASHTAHKTAPAEHKPVVHKVAAPVKTVVKSQDTSRAVGRRKRASARVRIQVGTGKITVNGKEMAQYFPYFVWQEIIISPLKAVAKDKSLDVSVKVSGGGKRGQAESIRHGIARALVIWNEDFKKSLRSIGLLTRDPRIKERKKFGLKKARRAPQWSKR